MIGSLKKKRALFQPPIYNFLSVKGETGGTKSHQLTINTGKSEALLSSCKIYSHKGLRARRYHVPRSQTYLNHNSPKDISKEEGRW
jgi:hypothetical protein